jgi:hypothetical protein
MIQSRKERRHERKYGAGVILVANQNYFSIFSFLHNVGLWIFLRGMRASVLEILRFGTENVTDPFFNSSPLFGARSSCISGPERI